MNVVKYQKSHKYLYITYVIYSKFIYIHVYNIANVYIWYSKCYIYIYIYTYNIYIYI